MCEQSARRSAISARRAAESRLAVARDENKLVRRDAVRAGPDGPAAACSPSKPINDADEEVNAAANKAARLIEPGGK